MIKLYSILVLLSFIFISCASSTRFPSRHNTEDDVDSLGEYRYDKKENKKNNDTFEDNNIVLESRVGIASYYSDKYQGYQTSSGEIFDQNKLTAAHPSYLPGTIVRIKNLKNRKVVIVRINDRMKNQNGRIIDVSKKAAEDLDMIKEGIAKVQVDVLKWGDSDK